MPDRIIRDELLTSPRYWAVSIEAQRLYVHLLLSADDTARFSGNNYTIRLACYPGHQVASEKVESLLVELVDKDLVRLYAVGDERFVFIPRFKQRLRYRSSRYPEPPISISDLGSEKSDSRRAQDGPKSVPGQTQVSPKSAEVKRSEEKNYKRAPARFNPPDWIPQDCWDAYAEMRTKIRKPMTLRAMQLAVATLDRLRKEGSSARAVLEQSILNSWQGLFAVKSQGDPEAKDKHGLTDRQRRSFM